MIPSPLALLIRLATIATVLLSLALPVSAATKNDQAVWIEAWGHAAPARGESQDSAKRRALINALVNAGLQGGATIRGYTFMDKSNIVADRALMLAKGRVMRHKILSSNFDGNLWQVRVQALVGPVPAGYCGSKRSLVISAHAPTYRMSPHVPAFTLPMAQEVYKDMLYTIERNPATRLERVMASTGRESSTVRASGMDYSSLTRGTAPSSVPGDHVLRVTFNGDVALQNGMQTVVLNIDIDMRESNGNIRTHRIQRAAPVPKNTTLHGLTLRTRTTTEALLLRGVGDEFNQVLSALGCEPPAARVDYASNTLSVPVGARHGITRGALAVLEDPNDSFGLLEITKLENNRAVLHPLDPTRSASSFAGRLVYFMEAGL
jgi:hypothetical protein